ncbi:hypothetical protein Agub_g12687, partial [Astrephomene gubernaculifera]
GFCLNMKPGVIIALLLGATALTVANAQQTGLYPNFPYCACSKASSAYSLSQTVKAKGAGQYCFTLRAKVPTGCTSYCCSKADFKKLEFNVNPTCDVFGAVVKATVNGVPTVVGPAFSAPKDGPTNSTMLRLTQLGLGLASDGAEICITLAANPKTGLGCTTLEQLCVPPAGMPAGVCSAAMFDSNTDCCPISQVGVPSPPPPSPP